MRVLLTGGAGFIGSRVLAELIGRGHDVRVYDSLRDDVHHGRAAVAARGGGVRRTPTSATPTRCYAALAGIDAVCHLAAKVGLGVDVADLPDYAGSQRLRHRGAAGGDGPGRRRAGLTLASSMVAYGEGLGRCAEHGAVVPGPRREADLAAGQFEPPCPRCGRALAPELVGEDTAVDPRNAYAASKVAQEHLSASWARVDRRVGGGLRYHNVYGPRPAPQHPVRRRGRDLPVRAGARRRAAGVRGRRPAPRLRPRRRRRRGHRHRVREPAGRRAAPTTSVRGRCAPVGDLAAALARAKHGPAPEITGRFRLGDVRHITADSSRLRAELGWRPQIEFDEGLAAAVG